MRDESRKIWNKGDRVRVIQSQTPYTGCRGTVLEGSGSAEGDQLPLGYYVAIDGENGVARPFLTDALERITAIVSRPVEAADQRQRR
ncbi:MAG: hypothetical protein GY733_05320 [bacterium]|nr:hypothetical protein [bacterium]